MERNFFGFLINHELLFDARNNRLIRIATAKPERSLIIGTVPLNDTLARLLVYLLSQGSKKKEIAKEDILFNVWDKNNLVSSSQKLWQAIRDIKIKLHAIGVCDEFIINIKGTGYSLNHHEIVKLYHH